MGHGPQLRARLTESGRPLDGLYARRMRRLLALTVVLAVAVASPAGAFALKAPPKGAPCQVPAAGDGHGDDWTFCPNGGLARRNIGFRYLRFAIFASADLHGANLQHSDLAWANFLKANLAGANLDGAYLDHANLIAADLTGANLSNANLTGADLESAKLTGATFTRATFSNTTCPNGRITSTGC